MPLDSSIPLQIKPVQFDSPFESQAKALQLKDMIGKSQLADLQLGQQRSAMERQTKLRDVYAGMSADTKEADRIAALRNAGFHDEADKWEGSALKRDESRAKTGLEQFKLLKEKTDYVNGALSSLLAKPQVTHDDVIAQVSNLVRQGVIDPEQGAQTVRDLPGDPGALRSKLLTLAMQTAEAGKRIDLMLPKTGTVDGGNRQIFTNTNQLTGEVTQTGQAQKAPEGYTIGPNGQLVIDPGYLRGKTQIAAAGATRVNIPINTEKTYAGNVAEGVAKQDLEAIEAAKSAPDKVRTARQIRDILSSGVPITGTLAEQRLAVSKALATAGLIDGKQAAATEGLASSLAAQTLSNIKTAGLGTGAGFTNADRDFLERAASGKIDMTPQALMRLTQLNESSAVRAVERGNKAIERLRSDPNMGRVAGAFEPISLPADEKAALAKPAAKPDAWRDAGYASPAAAVQDARTAISKGADKAAVIQRLEQAGITNHGIK